MELRQLEYFTVIAEELLGTINYEIVCMISKRVPRVHKGLQAYFQVLAQQFKSVGPFLAPEKMKAHTEAKLL